MDKLCADVVPIVVTYHPDKVILLANLRALLAQVKTVIVVDNGSGIHKVIQSIETKYPGRIRLLAFEQNYGLGEAYNAGIKIARDLEAKFILLMDQDSIPEPAMVSILRTTYLHLESQGKQIAVVGANYRNNSPNHTSCFLRVGQFGFKRLSCDKTNNFIRADFLISSGSLISLKALNQIGDMDSTLFIDHIDTEWCFRAKAKGFEVYGACTAIMNHLLGDRRQRFWWGRWRMVPCHQPFRYYYMLRNSALLWQRSYMPPGWKRADKMGRLYFLFFFSIFSPNRLANLRMMLKGLKDGLKGKSGQI